MVVVDPSGGVIPGAQLKLVDTATNDARQATTQEAGNYTFVNLSFGQYKLTVTKEGFETQSYNVTVQSARNTDVKAALKVGSTQQVVEVVGGAAPLVETTSSATNITIDTKMIEDLPIWGRSVTSFSQLAAGYNGTWNGLPTTAQGNTVDGIVGNTSRWRYSGGADSNGITPRLENIAEMTVSTDQLDLNSGWGNSNMQITYVTRRGTNNWHGRFFEDHRNAVLNAKDWRRTAPKAKYILNEFGGSAGGPILKDKLFLFGSFSMSKQPQVTTRTSTFLRPDAQSGIFTFGPANNQKTVSLYNVVRAYNTANGTTLPVCAAGASTCLPVNQVVQDRMKWINGTLSQGTLVATPPSDPNINQIYFDTPSATTYYYPTFRVDYNVSQNVRLNLAYNQTKYNRPNANAGWWPGDGKAADNYSNAATASFGLEWTISPTLINQFKGGYLYTASWFGQNGPDDFMTGVSERWNYCGECSGEYWQMPNSRMQPVFSMSDTMTWVKGGHTLSFGGNWYRDANKYWDPPEGYPIVNLALATGDPALQALTSSSLTVGGVAPTSTELSRARGIYAMLAGRVNDVNGRFAFNPATGKYWDGVAYSTLNELMKSWGLFFQDSYKVKRNFTLNYGLRWDFVSPDKDLTGKYHSMLPTDLFGPTGVWQLFQPGASSLVGTNDPVFTARESPYNSWNVTPQPAIGFAWTPRSNGSFIEKILGGDKTVVRAGYSYRRFTEPQQFVWDIGASYGVGFYQNFNYNPSTQGEAGTFIPGSLELGKFDPQNLGFVYAPNQYDKVIHQNQQVWNSPAVTGIDPNIRQPYVQSWNLGIQRELGASRAIEVRYNGNRTIHQWLAENINEINIFENGFLGEFKKAQNNLAIFKAQNPNCDKSGNPACSFANNGLAGQVALPIMAAAGISFTDATFKDNLVYGRAGTFANTLATNRNYFCRMVGSTFAPCGSTYGGGAGYPINFWRANPYAGNSWTNATYMTDRGFSNYNGLQVEFRQRQWHGATVTANYTWSRTLGVATAGDWTGGFTQWTIRDLHTSYRPAGTDRNHVIHVNATYDLPFGKGKALLNQGGVLDKVLGGWTVSTIITFQTGAPFRIGGNNNTFNNLTDGGVDLNGITADEIEKQIGLYYDANNVVYYLDPAYVQQLYADGKITAHTDPGTYGQILWLHGNHATYTDIGISKSASITERFKFKFQTQMLNAFNHPTFGVSSTGIADPNSFGRGSGGGTTRRIELRANLEF